MTRQKKTTVSAARVATGMALAVGSVAGSKVMSLVAQVILGYLFSAQTYGVFAAATAALVFATGLRNSGVSKLLIQQPEKFDELAPTYAGFAVLIGLVGTLLLVPAGFFLSLQNNMPTLGWVVMIASLSVPLSSLYSVAIARYSVELRYEERTANALILDAIYYAVLLIAAYIGAGEFSVASASVLSLAFLLPPLLRRVHLKIDVVGAISKFWKIAYEVRWTILAAYLFGLSKSGDYLVLGSFLEPGQLGIYYFGYMIVGNLSVLVSLAINQTLMPALANIRDDFLRLESAVTRSSGVVVVFSSFLSLGFIGLGGHVIHFIWNGKWDESIFVAMAIALTFPLRIMSQLGSVILESQGRWRTNSLFLLYDAAGLMVLAALGGMFGGVDGAAIGVAIHLGLTGLVVFPASLRNAGYGYRRAIGFTIKLAMPFVVSVGVLFGIRAFSPSSGEWWVDVGSTCLASIVLLIGSFRHVREIFRVFARFK